MPFNDSILNEQDKQKVSALSEQWRKANASGDAAGMNEAHSQAEAIRGKYGYSGGAAGDAYHATGENTRLPSAKDQSDYINQVYDAQLNSKKAALEAAYNQQMADYDAQDAKIPGAYNTAVDQASTQADINRANLNEQMAASGINTGAGSQLALSQANQRNSDIAEIRKAQADAVTELQTARTKTKTAYQDQIAQAIAENDTERAKALYAEAQRVDDSMISTALNQQGLDLSRAQAERAQLEAQAETLAKFGDFSGYLALGYTQDQVNGMQQIWAAQNPELSYYRTGVYPAGYGGGGGTGSGKLRGDGGTTPRTMSHEDINYKDQQAVDDAKDASKAIREMIARGDSAEAVRKKIQEASAGGLISDDAARRLNYSNNSRG